MNCYAFTYIEMLYEILERMNNVLEYMSPGGEEWIKTVLNLV